ncbi:hypothetical protein N0V94_007564 [Neodidymelliopsis sp. IMI 364377]|nr:hypothetical protein N0V94_007564 [Neodidymelliopsis sp. IMI 364377]
MIRASTSVVQRLKRLSRGPSQLGAIILDQKETEERRIIAGLIIRQGLDKGIDFADFWESDKVLHSAPNFPRISNEQWMGQFQTYLDTLSGLALANLSNDALVLFPMCLSSSDGFKWTGKSAVVVLETEMLTLVVADATLTKLSFIDIPINCIEKTSLQKTAPYESQEDRSEHETHDLVLDLAVKSSTYRLNSADHTASEFRISFLDHEDAGEFEVRLGEARKNSARSTTASAEVDYSSITSNSPADRRQSSGERIDTTFPPHSCRGSSEDVDSGSGDTPDERLSSDERRGGRRPMQHTARDKGSGKLPRISRTTKQNAVQAIRLPKDSAKVTRSRRCKNTTLSHNKDEDSEEDEGLSHDEYLLKSEVTRGPGKRRQGRRKPSVEDDDEFVPVVSKAKPKAVKRKGAPSVEAEDNLPKQKKKKIQTKTAGSSQLTAVTSTATKQKTNSQGSVQTSPDLAREPMKQTNSQHNLQKGTARHSLIGGLLKSKSPNKAPEPTFKRPGQPASTPGRPRSQFVQPSPKPQTPIETSGDSDLLPIYIPSSTPRRHAVHDEDFGIQYTPVDTEILSSNTKRVPDSPHAESTAISGHADHDDVHREKRKGDMELARSDPFKQRRQGHEPSSFTRRLTGEMSMVEDNLDDVSDVEEPTVLPASQPLPKHCTQNQAEPVVEHPLVAAELKSSPTTAKAPPAVGTASSQGTMRLPKQDAAHEPVPGRVERRARNEFKSPGQHNRAHPATGGNVDHAVTGAAGHQMPMNDSIVSAPQEAVDNTIPKVQTILENQIDLEGNTTLVGEELDLPNNYSIKASPIRFRSSPPIPDSSSDYNHSSDASEPEPEPSPPTSRADELEWEAALQPHQRTLQEQLLRTSRRVVRNIVDNETAVTDIADVFAGDGEHLLSLTLEQQSEESARAFQDLASKKQSLLKELSDASRELKTQRKRVRIAD